MLTPQPLPLNVIYAPCQVEEGFKEREALVVCVIIGPPRERSKTAAAVVVDLFQVSKTEYWLGQ